MSKARIFWVGDNVLANEALQNFLESKGFETHLSDINEGLERHKMKDLDPDIVILDEDFLISNDPILFERWKYIKLSYRSILILSTSTIRYLGLGITQEIEGYVHKRGGIKELVECVRKVMDGKIFISPLFGGAHDLVNNELRISRERYKDIESILTPQQMKILLLVKEDKTSKEIANLLHVTVKTVQNHRYSICKKLGLSGRNSLYDFSQLL